MVSTLVSYAENVNAEDAVKSMTLMSDKGVYAANLNNISLKCVDLMQNGIYATYAFLMIKKVQYVLVRSAKEVISIIGS